MTGTDPATIVERDDPALYATALFAGEPLRGRLMVLYAFDCELSRAARASAESLIPRMRLQWWRDVIEEAARGVPPKAHEVAGPLGTLVTGRADDAGLRAALEDMVASREVELSGPFHEAAFTAWCDGRYGGLTRAALGLAGSGAGLAGAGADATGVGRVLGTASALRLALRQGRDGHPTFLPGLTGTERAALGRGTVDETLAPKLAALAENARQTLASLRQTRRAWPRVAVPILLPLRRAGRVLDAVVDGKGGLGQIDEIDVPFDGLRLALAAARGRW